MEAIVFEEGPRLEIPVPREDRAVYVTAGDLIHGTHHDLLVARGGLHGIIVALHNAHTSQGALAHLGSPVAQHHDLFVGTLDYFKKLGPAEASQVWVGAGAPKWGDNKEQWRADRKKVVGGFAGLFAKLELTAAGTHLRRTVRPNWTETPNTAIDVILDTQTGELLINNYELRRFVKK